MNMRDLVLPISLAFVSVIVLNHFFPSNSTKESAESTFIAPREKKEYKPLNIEIDFYDQKRTAHTQLTDCETEWGHLSFSTDGASLDTVDFKRESNGKVTTVRTVFPVADDRENRCFLVALQNATPFYYTLLSQEESDNSYELLYAAGNEDCVIQKLFTIDKHNPKIDLSIEIAPKNGHHGNKIEPRVFFPAPIMPELKDLDVISSIVIDQNDVFAKTYLNKLNIHSGWFKPVLFGADDRYFIHALIADHHHFAQRAYYKADETTRLLSIVEGPAVTEKTSWTLSFYFGPKELNAIAAVDTRLEKTLEYSGMLSWLAKILLFILNWLYGFVHNYGFAIILLTLLIQICLLPVSLRNGEEKFKKQHAEYQRELMYIEQRFAGDPERLLAEKTVLIRKKGLPGMGCLLPLLLQIPIFFALSRVLSSSFELYKAPFLWIPDLSSRDPYFILSVLVVIAMLMQDTSGNPQQRMSKIVMAFVFGAITSSFSAGLTLYILMGRVFGFIQTRLMHFFKLV